MIENLKFEGEDEESYLLDIKIRLNVFLSWKLVRTKTH